MILYLLTNYVYWYKIYCIKIVGGNNDMEKMDKEAYQRLKHRKEQLEARVERDVPGPERETAKRLLKKVSKRLEEFENANGIIHEETTETVEEEKEFYTTSSKRNSKFGEFVKKNFGSFENFFSFMEGVAKKFEEECKKNPKNHNGYSKWYDYEEPEEYYQEETRSVDELIRDLGVLYLIFGSTYQTYFNYHVYKVRFLKEIENNGAFFRVKANIYEDDKLICKGIQIGFWPFHSGDDRVRDMEWSAKDNVFKKYDERSTPTRVFIVKILKEMQELWNSYFDGEVEKLPDKAQKDNEVEKLPDKSQKDNFVTVTMSKEERRRRIREISQNLYPKKFDKKKDILIKTDKQYKDLADYLETSGLVYEVRENAIYVWHYYYNRYFKLIGYNLTGRDKVLNLLPEQ